MDSPAWFLLDYRKFNARHFRAKEEAALSGRLRKLPRLPVI
jgi:hypothetical protein